MLLIVKRVEHFEGYLRGALGVDDIPLTYIIKNITKVHSIVDDSIVMGGSPYSISYTSFFDEMIAHSKLSGASFSENNFIALALLNEASPVNETEKTHSTPLSNRISFLQVGERNIEFRDGGDDTSMERKKC